MKRPDLIILVAIWDFLSAFGAMIGISAIGIFAIPRVLDLWGPGRIGGLFGLSIGIFILGCYVCLSLAAGIGILAGKEWGRILSIASAALVLFWLPIGTIIGILIIIYLINPEVKEHFQSKKK